MIPKGWNTSINNRELTRGPNINAQLAWWTSSLHHDDVSASSKWQPKLERPTVLLSKMQHYCWHFWSLAIISTLSVSEFLHFSIHTTFVSLEHSIQWSQHPDVCGRLLCILSVKQPIAAVNDKCLRWTATVEKEVTKHPRSIEERRREMGVTCNWKASACDCQAHLWLLLNFISSRIPCIASLTKIASSRKLKRHEWSPLLWDRITLWK